ncbi:FAD/NAD(P)-binding domain-containing protein [Tothia fuscella]|uniref:FAD/NAD(P)-binding domain-containing protein n=1 Tax=Tothia fuscella TaxID=1048955 RepID=A0A9P4U203_9PEZI|nr:FAD/NAD(P)-binding domain-containing protein [Tothia fuscella]
MSAGSRRFRVKNVAIIGAGPSGLAAAKFLLAEKAFTRIDVFEQRNHVGGLWKYTPETSGDGLFAIPQTNPQVGLEKPVWTIGEEAGREPTFLSPIYERLETNIPKTLMAFSDKAFPEDVPLFPGHDTVQEYLEEYSKDVISLIKFGTQVQDVQLLESKTNEDSVVEEQWSVETLHLESGKTTKSTYHAVVVASGHFSTPHIPDIPGVSDWNAKYPGSISPSKYYRIPEAFAGQKVVVVGNSASGLDISSQLSSFAKSPVLLSQKSESYPAGGFSQNANIEPNSQISRFNPQDKTIHFSNGRIEHNVDTILFCTGYLYTMPFLQNLSPNPIGDGSRVEHTYQHLFYTPHPTLCFLVLPQKIIPFPLSEAQSSVIARVCSGRLSLPSQTEMEKWEKDTIAEQGEGGDFHTLKFPKDAEYINMLYDWAACAERREGLEGGGHGKLARRWGEWEFWARENFPGIRRAFVERGVGRRDVRGLWELGFDFGKRHERMGLEQPEGQVTSA